MKAIKLVSLSLLSLGFFASCSSSDDGGGNTPDDGPSPGPGTEVTVSSTWKPTNFEIEKNGASLYTFNYPHTPNCEIDHLNFYSNNSNKYFHYEGSECTEEVTEDAFVKNGNQVTINVQGYPISGTVVETSTEMKVSSDIDQYQALIEAMYPQYAQMLSMFEGATVILTFEKQ